MKQEKPGVYRRFIFINLAAVLSLSLFLLLDSFDLWDGILFCPLHMVGIYCPTCGITRATHALLRLDFISALRYNPLIFLLIFVVTYYETYGLLGVIKKNPTFITRAGQWPVMTALLLFGIYFLVRNLLLLFAIDPTGDFLGV